MQVGTYPTRNFATLETVIVTAAVYRSFGCEPPFTANLFLNLPAPGRRQSVYSTYVFAQTCVFSKQSPDPFHCGPPRLLHPKRHPLSRSYGVNLPSSFTSVISSAVEYSSHLPLSVLVRAPILSGIGFLDCLSIFGSYMPSILVIRPSRVGRSLSSQRPDTFNLDWR